MVPPLADRVLMSPIVRRAHDHDPGRIPVPGRQAPRHLSPSRSGATARWAPSAPRGPAGPRPPWPRWLAVGAAHVRHDGGEALGPLGWYDSYTKPRRSAPVSPPSRTRWSLATER